MGNGKYLQADAARNFKAMQADARRAGINLAAKPGYSTHQNGISVDIGGVNGYGTNAFKWLSKNAGRYGFVNDVKGEFWHWTYRGPRS